MHELFILRFGLPTNSFYTRSTHGSIVQTDILERSERLIIFCLNRIGVIIGFYHRIFAARMYLFTLT